MRYVLFASLQASSVTLTLGHVFSVHIVPTTGHTTPTRAHTMRLLLLSSPPRSLLLFLLFLCLSSSLAALQAASYPQVIFDTDMSMDCDDTAALAILHNMMSQGQVELVAVVHNTGIKVFISHFARACVVASVHPSIRIKFICEFFLVLPTRSSMVWAPFQPSTFTMVVHAFPLVHTRAALLLTRMGNTPSTWPRTSL